MLKTIPQILAQIRASLTTVTAVEAFMQSKENNALVIDVREPSEFADKAASGAINIPRGLLEMKILQMYPDAEKAIFVHCATGARATFSAEQLMRLGYQNVSIISCELDDICNAFG